MTARPVRLRPVSRNTRAEARAVAAAIRDFARANGAANAVSIGLVAVHSDGAISTAFVGDRKIELLGAIEIMRERLIDGFRS